MKYNYVRNLLVSKNHHGDSENFTTIEQIKRNYEKILNVLTGKNGYQRNNIKKYEELAALKLAYLNIMTAIQNENGGKILADDVEFNKEKILELAEETSKKVAKSYLEDKEKDDENPRKNNEYKTLILQPRTHITEVTDKYLKFLKGWNKELDIRIEQGIYNAKENEKAERVLLEKKEAYASLSDPNYKMKLDEILLLNFSPNQEKKYIPNNVTEVTYIPEEPIEKIDKETGRTYYALNSYVLGNIKKGNDTEIIITHVGNIGFGRFRKANGDVTYRSARELKDYRIVKRYKNKELAEKRKKACQGKDSLTIWDDKLDGEVFRVSGNLHENILLDSNVDPMFVLYTYDVLLSNTNLEEAIEHNGGYIGVVVINPNNEYTVEHDSDQISTAKGFEKIRKTTPIDRKIIIYKLDKGTAEIYQKDINTGEYLKETVQVSSALPKRNKTVINLGEK